MTVSTLFSNTRQLLITSTLSSLLALGSITGANATSIAYFDHGIDTDFAADIPRVLAGFDFVNDDDIPDDESPNKHGTSVGQVLLNDTRVTNIVPIKVTAPGYAWDLERGNAAMRYILTLDDVRVIDFQYLQPIDVSLLQQAVKQNKVIVTQAGNHSLDSPNLGATLIPLLNGGGLIVGGLDSNDQIHQSSNRAGDLADHYVVAPAFNSFTDTQGTSLAKPHVSAAAALLIEAAPNLSAKQVVEIIKTTATDLGEVGVDPIYGHGKLNVERALSPQGLGSVGGESGNGSGGGSGGGAIAALAIGGAIGWALMNRSKTLQKTLVLDSYDRPYYFDLASRAPKVGLQDTTSILGFKQTSAEITQYQQHTGIAGFDSQTLSLGANRPTTVSDWFNPMEADERDSQLSFALDQTSADGDSLSMVLNQPLALHFGAASQSAALSGLSSSQLFASPFLGYAGQNVGVRFGQQNSSTLGLLKTSFGLSSNDDQGRHGASSDAILLETLVEKDQGSVGLQLAYTEETDALFGSADNGPLSVGGAQTLSIALSGHYALSERVTLFGQYAYGTTAVQAEKGSLLNGFSRLNSQSAALGLSAKKLFHSEDQLALSVSQPLHVSQGWVDLHTPTSQDSQFSPIYENERVNLGAAGTPETRLELGYSRPLGSFSLNSHLVYRNNTYADDGEQYGVAIHLSKQW